MRDGIVTGEGVVVDARPAAFLTRGLALLIDLVALTVVVVALAWAMSGLALPAGYESPLIIAALASVFLARSISQPIRDSVGCDGKSIAPGAWGGCRLAVMPSGPRRGTSTGSISSICSMRWRLSRGPLAAQAAS